ncbi:MAG TPA: DUF4845 domain-containing protein [Rhodocyclaceae bacterium]|nr:DUF4845 domain-containing protein [Rhodocyclaceae bacterium]
MKNQRGFSLSGVMVWGVVFILVAVLAMKVAPSVIEYYKILKDSKAVVEQAQPGATVADVRKAFARFAEIDYLEFSPDQLDISKENGQLVVSFDYEKRIHLFRNVSLVIEYQGSTAPGG